MTDMIYYDRWGAKIAPGPQSVVRPRIAIHVIAISKNSAGLVVWPKRGHGTIQLPGGGLEENESPQMALAREWAEETGLPIEPLSPPHATYRLTHGFYNENLQEFWTFDQTFVKCGYDADVEVNAKWLNPEGDEISWLPVQIFDSLPFSYNHRAGITKLLPGISFPPIVTSALSSLKEARAV